jgi:hypothetical protein
LLFIQIFCFFVAASPKFQTVVEKKKKNYAIRSRQFFVTAEFFGRFLT